MYVVTLVSCCFVLWCCLVRCVVVDAVTLYVELMQEGRLVDDIRVMNYELEARGGDG